MKNHWLNKANLPDILKYPAPSIPRNIRQQLATPFFVAKIADVKDPHKQGRIKIHMTPKIAQYFGNGKGTSLWAYPIANQAGQIAVNLIKAHADVVCVKDKNGNLFWVGIKQTACQTP